MGTSPPGGNQTDLSVVAQYWDSGYREQSEAAFCAVVHFGRLPVSWPRRDAPDCWPERSHAAHPNLRGFQRLVLGWEIAIVSTLKILIMIVADDLVTATTPTQAMLSCVERALSPLCRLIRRNPRRISLAVALTMRFIPVLSDQWRTQRNAWQARSKRAPGVRLLIPFFLQAFNRTDQIAESLRARARH